MLSTRWTAHRRPRPGESRASVRHSRDVISGSEAVVRVCAAVGSAHSIGCDKLWTAREAMPGRGGLVCCPGGRANP